MWKTYKRAMNILSSERILVINYSNAFFGKTLPSMPSWSIVSVLN
jgi:hypothetical protein